MSSTQEELTRTKAELAKTKDEVSKLKTQLQAASKTSKDDDKSKARTAAKIQNLEAENGRLSSAAQAKTKDLKRQVDISEKLETEVRDLKRQVETLEREKANVQAARIAGVRKQRDWDDDYDDYEEYSNFVPSQPTKRSRLSLSRPSIETAIQRQVAEALKTMVSSTQYTATPSAGDVYQPAPHAHVQHMDTASAHQRSFEPYQGRASAYQIPVPPPVVNPLHKATATAPASVPPPLTWPPSSSTWPSSPIEMQMNTPLGAVLSSTSVPQQPTRAASPVVNTSKADSTGAAAQNAQLFKAFLEFMSTQK